MGYQRYAKWKVTTEGDCEGRSVRTLGVFEGNFDEVAMALADKCYYSLQFEPVEPKTLDLTPVRNSVSVSFGIGSNTWGMTPERRAEYFASLLPDDGPVSVETGTYYASVKLVLNEPLDDRAVERKKLIEKLELTDEQLELLKGN